MNEPEEQPNNTIELSEPAIASVALVAGGAAGYGAVAAMGMSAIGMVGGGTGIGAVAGPVGVVAGAMFGLALYGVYRVVRGS